MVAELGSTVAEDERVGSAGGVDEEGVTESEVVGTKGAIKDESRSPPPVLDAAVEPEKETPLSDPTLDAGVVAAAAGTMEFEADVVTTPLGPKVIPPLSVEEGTAAAVEDGEVPVAPSPSPRSSMGSEDGEEVTSGAAVDVVPEPTNTVLETTTVVSGSVDEVELKGGRLAATLSPVVPAELEGNTPPLVKSSNKSLNTDRFELVESNDVDGIC